MLLVALWGYGDLVGEWYSKPSPHPRHHRIKLDREEAWKQGERFTHFRFAVAQGQRWDVLSILPPARSMAKGSNRLGPEYGNRKFFPYMAVKNVDAKYPPHHIDSWDRVSLALDDRLRQRADSTKSHTISAPLSRLPPVQSGHFQMLSVECNQANQLVSLPERIAQQNLLKNPVLFIRA